MCVNTHSGNIFAHFLNLTLHLSSIISIAMDTCYYAYTHTPTTSVTTVHMSRLPCTHDTVD